MWVANTTLKYINSELKDKFDLDTTSKPKPVAGPDDLLLLLTYHWARDEAVFPTEDDRHDVATIMLFQAYTGARPAEYVHASKGKASQDPLGEAEEWESIQHYQKRDEDHGQVIAGHSVDFDSVDDSDLEFDNNVFDCSDEAEDHTMDEDDDTFSDKAAEASIDFDSGYGSDCTDVSMKDCGTKPVEQKCDVYEEGDIRACKALCYEDIVLWVVLNPQKGERDVLAMEVSLRYHKGVDNKPKPYVALHDPSHLS